MEKQKSNKVMLGILICLIIIALKPVPMLEESWNDSITVENYESEKVIHIGDNRLAIINNYWNSGNHGNITVLEFNEKTKKFEKVTNDNYLPYLE